MSHDLGLQSQAVSNAFTANPDGTLAVCADDSAAGMTPVQSTTRQRLTASADEAGPCAVGTHDPGRAALVAPVQPPESRFLQLGHDSHAQSKKRARENIEAMKAQLKARVELASVAIAREELEEREFEKQLQKEDPACMGSTAAASTQDMNPDERKFIDTLINGTKDKLTGNVRFAGIMCKKNVMGQANLPYTHQRNVVRNIASKKTTSYIVAHDPGLGKTATALMACCAEGCMLERMPKVLISVPSATLDQWEDSVADWIRVLPSKVLVTSKLKDVTRDVLKHKDVVILSRDCVARAYATCFQHYQKHHQIQTGPGMRWVSQWDRIGVFDGPGAMAALHPLFDPPTDEEYGWHGHWDVMIVDEVCFVTRTHALAHIPTAEPHPTTLSGALLPESRLAVLRIPRRSGACGYQAHRPDGHAARQQDAGLWRHCQGTRRAARANRLPVQACVVQGPQLPEGESRDGRRVYAEAVLPSGHRQHPQPATD